MVYRAESVPAPTCEVSSQDQVIDLLEAPEYTFVMVHASWCEYCVQAKPHFYKAAAISDKVKFAGIDAEAYGLNLEVNGFPTFGFLGGGNFIQTGVKDRSVDGMLRVASLGPSLETTVESWV